ncbi:recombinase family protein, partial [Niveibacterium sp. 24ML]|uniref:recombinase family protein n=1 Tax=Niveibacterium sp. 24ML TaxID=2985512 RepID=UPI00226FFEC9
MKTNASLALLFYGRYSDDGQSPTSIEDQLRRCAAIAAQHGFDPESAVHFTDEEMSGFKAAEASKRPGFAALLARLRTLGRCVLIVDEFSRLARNRRQQLEVLELMEGGVRVITGNGLDSTGPNGAFLFGLYGLLAQEESKLTAFRVKRGLRGQLERGYMIAPPAWGYTAREVVEPGARTGGTVWDIEESEAVLVCDVFERRCRGQSYAQIAAWLNETGTPSRRRGTHWRSAAVRQVVANTIYRGVFTLHCSAHVLAEARRRGEGDPRVEFPRPDARIVSDDVWFEAQGKRSERERAAYGGGRSMLSGCIRCGTCGNHLCSQNGGSRMECGACRQAHAVAAADALAQVPSVATEGLLRVIKACLLHALGDAVLSEIRARLQARLAAGPGQELTRLRETVERKEREAKRLLRLVQSDESDDLAADAYRASRAQLDQARQALSVAERTEAPVRTADIQRQLTVDMAGVIDRLLDGTLPCEQVRKVLSALFRRLTFLGKPARYTSLFEVELAPGAALAWQTGTENLVETTLQMRVRLESGAQRPTVWRVTIESAELKEGSRPAAWCKSQSEGHRLRYGELHGQS